MTIFEETLILCGSFTDINGTNFNNVVRWDGINFTAMGTGLGDNINSDVGDVHVNARKLYAIGSFVKNGDGDDVLGLSVWNPTDEVWEQAGENKDLDTVFGNSLSTFTGKLDGQLPE